MLWGSDWGMGSMGQMTSIHVVRTHRKERAIDIPAFFNGQKIALYFNVNQDKTEEPSSLRVKYN